MLERDFFVFLLICFIKVTASNVGCECQHCCKGQVLFVLAHPDDEILFMVLCCFSFICSTQQYNIISSLIICSLFFSSQMVCKFGIIYYRGFRRIGKRERKRVVKCYEFFISTILCNSSSRYSGFTIHNMEYNSRNGTTTATC